MRVVITGGGTGGHTSAGLAVAAALRARGDDVSLDRQPGGHRGAAGAGGGHRRSTRSRWASCAATGTGRTCPTSPGARPRAWSSRSGSCGGSRPTSSSPPAASWRCPSRSPRARSACPLVVHEQTSVPGLANRIAGRFARRIAVTFPAPDAGLSRRPRRPHRQSPPAGARRRLARGGMPAIRPRPRAPARVRHGRRAGLARDQPDGRRGPRRAARAHPGRPPVRATTPRPAIGRGSPSAPARCPPTLRARLRADPLRRRRAPPRLRGGGSRHRAQRRGHGERVLPPRPARDLHPAARDERRRADGQRPARGGGGRRRRAPPGGADARRRLLGAVGAAPRRPTRRSPPWGRAPGRLAVPDAADRIARLLAEVVGPAAARASREGTARVIAGLVLLQAALSIARGRSGDESRVPAPARGRRRGLLHGRALTVTLETSRSEPLAAEALAAGQVALAATSLDAALQLGHAGGASAAARLRAHRGAARALLLVPAAKKDSIKALRAISSARPSGSSRPARRASSALFSLLAREGIGVHRVNIQSFGERAAGRALESGRDRRPPCSQDPWATPAPRRGQGGGARRSPHGRRGCALARRPDRARRALRPRRAPAGRPRSARARPAPAPSPASARRRRRHSRPSLPAAVVGTPEDFALRLRGARDLYLPDGRVTAETLAHSVALVRARAPFPRR